MCLEAKRERRVEFTEDETDASRREQVREAISRRISNACAHLSEAEFRQLTEQMADRQLTGVRRASLNYWRDVKPR